MASGDVEPAVRSGTASFVHAFFCGQSLEMLERELATFCRRVDQLEQEGSLYQNRLFQQTILNLLGRGSDPCRLTGDVFNEDEALDLFIETKDNTKLFYLWVNKLFLSYLFQDYRRSLACSDEAIRYVGEVPGLYAVTLFYFFDSLARLANLSKK